MRKVSIARELVMDICAGTCCTAKACMSVDHHRKFVRLDVNPEVRSAAERDLVLEPAARMRNQKSAISDSHEVDAAAKVFTDETVNFRLGRKAVCGKFRLD